MSESLGDNILRLRGLPRQATREDVVSFFSGCRIKNGVNGVHMTLSPLGRPSGEAYVELESEEDHSKGLDKHKKNLGNRYVEVLLSNRKEMDWALRRNGTTKNDIEPALDGFVRPRGSPFDCSEDNIANCLFDQLFKMSESLGENVLRLRGLPRQATQQRPSQLLEQSRSSRRANLIHTLQMESKQLRELKFENEQLKKALEEYQVTVQFLMKKYRALTERFSESKLSLPAQLTLDDHEAALARQYEKINEMSAVMAKAVQLDENASEKEDQNLIEKLRKENDRLRSLLSS